MMCVDIIVFRFIIVSPFVDSCAFKSLTFGRQLAIMKIFILTKGLNQELLKIIST